MARKWPEKGLNIIGENGMHGVFYLIGLIVVVLAVLNLIA